jgi:hypothetical protein
MALQANDITLRLNDGTKWNEYAFSSRFDGALLLNGHDIDIIPKDVLSRANVPCRRVGRGRWWRTEAPIVSARFSHVPTPVAQYPKLSDVQQLVRDR